VRWPAAFAVVATALVVAFTDALDHLFALAMFALAFFALAALTAEFWRGASAQRALGGGSWIGALGKVTARNRRRYGGYIVHAGIAILFIAVAASSSFQTSRDLRMKPGDSAPVGDYTVTYVKPWQTINGAEQRLTFGATLTVSRDGKQVTTLNPSRNYYSSSTSGPTIQGFFEGDATSEVGRRTEFGRDIWTSMRPDLTSFDPVITALDKRLARSIPDIGPQGPTPEQIQAMRSYAARQGTAIRNLASLYVANPLPVDFRVNVNPLVSWIWVGGAIGVIGALIAIWPAPDARRRRVSDVYAARLARDLGRI
jgi:cytochrome c-type biogenesis protein CcmF